MSPSVNEIPLALSSRLRGAALPAMLGPAQVFLFGPYALHAGNRGEFALGFGNLIWPPLVGLAVATLVLVALGAALGNRLYRPYLGLLVGLGLALWLQANLLPGNLPILDGSAVDWTLGTLGHVGQAGVWLVVPLGMVTLARRFEKGPVRIASCWLTAQLLLLGISVLWPPSLDAADRTRWSEPPSTLFELSSRQNAVHLVLDGFQGDVFAELISREPELGQRLDGFTFFADHAGAFRTTAASIPAMLTGVTYRNELPLGEFVGRTFAETSLFTALDEHGWEVDFASITGNFFAGPITTRYFLPRPYVGFDEHRRVAAAELIDVSLLRHAPQRLKPLVLNDNRWLLRRHPWWVGSLTASQRSQHASNGIAFLRDLTTRLELARQAPVYKILHVGSPHPPVVVDADCRFVGAVETRRQPFLAQSRCTLEAVHELLNRLRDLAVYDDALVLLTSDHGTGLPDPDFAFDDRPRDRRMRRMAGRASALLAIKPPGRTGPLEISQAPTTLTDIPATVLDGLNLSPVLPGRSAQRLDPGVARLRHYATYEWDNTRWGRDYLPPLEVYPIVGPLTMSSSWQSPSRMTPPVDGSPGELPR